MSVKKGLGRNFSSLIPTDLLDESFDPTAGQDEQISDLRNIKLSEITADPHQPRRHFDEEGLEELQQSIVVHGVLQPIVVTPFDGGYQIVAGERRFRAAQTAGLQTIPALVRTLSGQHKLELALIENLQRRDLNALETATAYAKLRDQFNLTLEEIGHNVGGKTSGAISNTLRLLKLPKQIQQAIAEGKVTEGQARSLVGLEESYALSLLERIIREGWSARKVEQVVRDHKHPVAKKAVFPSAKQESLKRSAEQLTTHYNTSVQVKINQKGTGHIQIAFKNTEEFERIKNALL